MPARRDRTGRSTAAHKPAIAGINAIVIVPAPRIGTDGANTTERACPAGPAMVRARQRPGLDTVANQRREATDAKKDDYPAAAIGCTRLPATGEQRGTGCRQSKDDAASAIRQSGTGMVEPRGIEPLTFAMPLRRSPS